MQTKHDMRAILGEDFFKEEVRCDYLISETQKMVWALQLDLYLVFRDICTKYNLKHWFMYGSLLGAVRHNGFIPWDDDIDVAMPRKDYDIFVKVAPKELEEPYALQSPYTYPNCYMSNVTMRNSMGTFTPKIFKHLDYNKGIPLDIFPFDFCDPEKWEEDKEKMLQHIKKCSSWMKMQNPEYLTPEMRAKCLANKTDNPLLEWEAMNRIASNPEYNNSDYMMMKVVLDKQHLERTIIYKTEWFEKMIPYKFEKFEVEIPVCWHEVLNVRYGKDFMSYPPIQQRGAVNDQLIVNPFIPYKEYNFND